MLNNRNGGYTGKMDSVRQKVEAKYTSEQKTVIEESSPLPAENEQNGYEKSVR